MLPALWYHEHAHGEQGSAGGLRAVKINQAKDQARARPQSASDPQPEDADEPMAVGNPLASPAVAVTSIKTSGRRWTVRVHWGIIFAIVASLILWFAIKSFVELAF